MRKTILALALCLAGPSAFAAPPDESSASLKPDAADLTGPQRGVHPTATPAAPSSDPAPAPPKTHKHRHKTKPPANPAK